jgi:hypothetical protein
MPVTSGAERLGSCRAAAGRLAACESVAWVRCASRQPSAVRGQCTGCSIAQSWSWVEVGKRNMQPRQGSPYIYSRDWRRNGEEILRFAASFLCYKQQAVTRWLKGGKNFQASREAKRPCNSMSMRVQAPPLRCRGDSLSPNPATGPQGVAAGINGEIWEPHPDRSLRRNLWAAKAKTWLSHRDCKPA